MPPTAARLSFVLRHLIVHVIGLHWSEMLRKADSETRTAIDSGVGKAHGLDSGYWPTVRRPRLAKTRSLETLHKNNPLPIKYRFQRRPGSWMRR
jgi:hypothetical protein